MLLVSFFGRTFILMQTIESESKDCLVEIDRIVGVQGIADGALIYYEGSDEPFAVSHSIESIIELAKETRK